ncbi:MAG: DUF5596 domain-containing protein [Lachnospiraceae bacterium]|nr:DUF5596 domain-containing protein [Lachnospiraceae bacterium]
MRQQEFYQGICLMSEAVEALENLSVSEREYREARQLFWQNRGKFYRQTKKLPDFRSRFLYYFCRLAQEAYADYQKRRIPDEIYWNTFSDLTLWCSNCWEKFGEYGIDQYDWFFRHISLTLFGLGRLQFERLASPWEFADEVRSIQKGDSIICIHIPQGGKLVKEEVVESLEKAFAFLGREIPYLCHSWLLYPGLCHLLEEDSHILQFQRLFTLLSVDEEERQGEERIFGQVLDNPIQYSQYTTLQRKARQYLMEGGRLGSGIGRLMYDKKG